MLLGAAVFGFTAGYKANAQAPGAHIEIYNTNEEDCAGLSVADDRPVKAMMDCDDDEIKETDVNTGFDVTSSGGKWYIEIQEETANRCGYSTSNPNRQSIDIEIRDSEGNLVAYLTDVPVTDPGKSEELILENTIFTNKSTYDWYPGMAETNISDSGGGYNIYEGDLDELRANGGLSFIPVTSLACGIQDTFLSGLRDPLPGEKLFFYITPISPTEIGERGCVLDHNDGKIPRPAPLSGEC